MNSVEWDNKGENLAICTYSKLALVSVNSADFNVINSSTLSTGKLLFAKWNPCDELYVGGLF